MLIRFFACSVALGAAACSLFACGTTEEPSDDGSQAILGGTTSSRRDVILITTATSDEVLCSGSLIAPNVILTAAHCAIGRAGWAYLGYSKAQRQGSAAAVEDTSRTWRRVQIIDEAKSPGYSSQTCPFTADVALMRLDESVSQPAVELATEVPPVGTACAVFGYGRHDPNADLDTRLSDITAYTMGEQRTANVTVASTPEQGAFSVSAVDGASWRGDSGGPLVCDGRVVGVVSCSPSSAVTVREKVTYYASVPSARAFIDETVARWPRPTTGFASSHLGR